MRDDGAVAGSGAESGLAVALTREDCLDRVAGATYGRIIYTHGALPAVLPVAFAFDEDRIVFDVDSTSSLATSLLDAVLTFHVDDVDLRNRMAWSVTITGRAGPHGEPNRTRQGSAPSESVRLGLTAERVVGYRTPIHAPTR
jgi:uncharacterized protein